MNRKPYLDNLPLVHQGKVRDTFEVPGRPDLLLMVATDAISTHNVAHTSLIPLKGQFLTAMSVFFAFGPLRDIPTHIFRYGYDIYNYLDGEYPSDLHLRSFIVKKLYMAPFELIYRRRMAGSLWNDYYKKGLANPYGINFPKDLQLMSPLFPVAFTPTEKSATDDPVSGVVVRSLLSPHVVNLAYKVYQRGHEFALRKGVEIIDFKAEVGIDSEGKVCLGDEWLTGDCCRFVEPNKIVVGEDPPWADKEIFRQDSVRQWGGKKSGPPLTFSDEVINAGVLAYRTVFERIAGCSLETFQNDY